MKIRWLLLSFLGVIIFGAPADAGQVVSWEFKKNKNRLVFKTDEDVQPQAKLIANPTRLVIDLPGTQLGRTTIKEDYSGAVRGFRVGQSTEDIVSFVVELAPGYVYDPKRIKFVGKSPTNWSVELPSPRIGEFPSSEKTSGNDEQIIALPTSPKTISNRRIIRDTPSSNPPSPNPPSSNSPSPNISSPNRDLPPVSRPAPISSSPFIKTTSQGFALKIDGDRGDRIIHSRKGDKIVFTIEDKKLPEELIDQSFDVKEHGVQSISFSQKRKSLTQVTLQLESDSGDWRARFSSANGLILIPGRTIAKIDKEIKSTNRNNSATISEINFAEDGSQLSISSNRNVVARSEYIGRGTYEITINDSQLGEPFSGPQLRANSPISELKVKEKGSNVVLLVTTKLGTRLGSIVNGPKLVSLSVISPKALPVNNPRNPRVARTKPLVIIDPGHGGQDPGTIGINGVVEKNIVLPISLEVAKELEKQGITVKLTRDRDNFVSLDGRTDLANNVNADLFVSIHANAINLSRPDVNGLETYYYKSGRRLAEVIHWNVLNNVNIRDRKIRRSRFFVLRHSKAPAVLVEVGFLTGREDSRNLQNSNHRSQIAKAIARGIVQYVKESRI